MTMKPDKAERKAKYKAKPPKGSWAPSEAEPEADAGRPLDGWEVDKVRGRLFGGQLMSVNDVADVLGIHPRTVTEYIRDGRLAAFQIAGAWKVTEPDLQSFVDTLRTGPARASTGAKRTESLVGQLYGIGLEGPVSSEQLAELAAGGAAEKLIAQLHGIGLTGGITADQLVALVRAGGEDAIFPLYGVLEGPVTADDLVRAVQ